MSSLSPSLLSPIPLLPLLFHSFTLVFSSLHSTFLHTVCAMEEDRLTVDMFSFDVTISVNFKPIERPPVRSYKIRSCGACFQPSLPTHKVTTCTVRRYCMTLQCQSVTLPDALQCASYCLPLCTPSSFPVQWALCLPLSLPLYPSLLPLPLSLSSCRLPSSTMKTSLEDWTWYPCL